MDNPRADKVAVVDEVRERLSAADAALLTEYRGLKVGDMAQLRRNLREAGGEYKVYKNTLVRFAVRELGLDELEELLTGPTAIAFVHGDAASVAKALRDYSRTNPALVIKGGLLSGRMLSAAEAGALAELPPREVLLARFAGLLAAPMQQFAGLLQALPRNFAYGLKALIDQGGAPGAPAPEPAAEPVPEPPAVESAAEPVPEPPAVESAEGETRPAENVAPSPAEREPVEGAADVPPEPAAEGAADAGAAAADEGERAAPDDAAAAAGDEPVTDPAPGAAGAEAETQEES